MADSKISALPASTTPLSGTEVLPIVQSGATKQVSVQNILSSVQPTGTANGVSYMNGSKVLTTGAEIVFDGTSLGVGTSSPAYKLDVYQSGVSGAIIDVARFFANAGSTAEARILLGSSANSVIAGIGARPISGTDGVLKFYTEGAGVFSERVRIDNIGNVGIGTTGPSASAILDVQSTTKGVRMPNMTTAQKNAIASPVAGLMVFDTTLAKLCVYTGAAWQTITSV